MEHNKTAIIEAEKALQRLQYTMKASTHAIMKFNESYSKLPRSIKRQIRHRKYNKLTYRFEKWLKSNKLFRIINSKILKRK